MNSSILSFKGQAQGAEGLLVSANDFVIEDVAIEDTKGDALKINQSKNVTIRRVRTEWTNGAKTENGASPPSKRLRTDEGCELDDEAMLLESVRLEQDRCVCCSDTVPRVLY